MTILLLFFCIAIFFIGHQHDQYVLPAGGVVNAQGQPAVHQAAVFEAGEDVTGSLGY